MKKSFLFLAVASVFALASCGEKPAETTEAVDSTAVAAVDTVAAVDSTVADSAAATVDSAAAAH